MPTDVVIVSAARTPDRHRLQGLARPASTPSPWPRSPSAPPSSAPGIPADQIEDMGFGESMQGGGNIGRNVAIRLGLTNVPGVATQRWCASGMAGTQWVAANIAAGMIDVGIGGGVESMSTAPGTLEARPRRPPEFWMSPGNPEHPRGAPPFNMALTVGDNTARIAGVTREEADAWAFESHLERRPGHRRGPLQERDRARSPCPTAASSRSTSTPAATRTPREAGVAGRAQPRRSTGAITTAGNSSGLNDAAAALVLCTP